MKMMLGGGVFEVVVASFFLRSRASIFFAVGSTGTVSTTFGGGSIITTSSSSSMFSGFTFTSKIVLNNLRNSSRDFGGSAPDSILAWYVTRTRRRRTRRRTRRCVEKFVAILCEVSWYAGLHLRRRHEEAQEC